MIDRDDVRKNLEEWLKNPSWAEYYGSAPSDRCREFIALEYYYSEYEDDEAAEAMDTIEETLDLDDLRHLYRYCPPNPRKGVLARRIAEMEKAGNG